ncbi:hypothetical protein AB8615_00930 [Litorimonas sp. RW-G-Af-16]|uniref:hypothetical protein n=1 Tax=Litorimonas sp. RW-G-Af-16 TaxID=3241168 RepID=UPI003AB04100
MANTLSFARFRSAKRHLWLVSLLFPLTPLLGVVTIWMSGNAWFAWLPVAMFYIVMPLLDALIGEDTHDLLGLMEDAAEMSRFYQFMVHMLLPLIYLTWVIGAWFVVSHPLPVHAYIALAIAHGWGLAFAINAGHETGHKTDKISKWIALLMLAPSFLGHFRIEHNRGHHSAVATPEDHATARFGESYWAFILREYPGGWKRAWAIESERARRKGYSKFSLRNEVVACTLMQIMIYGAVIAALDPGRNSLLGHRHGDLCHGVKFAELFRALWLTKTEATQRKICPVPA